MQVQNVVEKWCLGMLVHHCCSLQLHACTGNVLHRRMSQPLTSALDGESITFPAVAA